MSRRRVMLMMGFGVVAVAAGAAGAAARDATKPLSSKTDAFHTFLNKADGTVSNPTTLDSGHRATVAGTGVPGVISGGYLKSNIGTIHFETTQGGEEVRYLCADFMIDDESGTLTTGGAAIALYVSRDGGRTEGGTGAPRARCHAVWGERAFSYSVRTAIGDKNSPAASLEKIKIVPYAPLPINTMFRVEAWFSGDTAYASLPYGGFVKIEDARINQLCDFADFELVRGAATDRRFKIADLGVSFNELPTGITYGAVGSRTVQGSSVQEC